MRGAPNVNAVRSVASLGCVPKKSTSNCPVARIWRYAGAPMRNPNSELFAVICVRPCVAA